MTARTEAVVKRVGTLTPELAEMLAEHEQFYDVLLPHVFFGEVSAWALARATADNSELDKLLLMLEKEYLDGDDDVRDLIGASLLENIEDNPDVVKRLGPTLLAASNPY